MTKPTEKAERELQFEKWCLPDPTWEYEPGFRRCWEAAWRAGAEDMRRGLQADFITLIVRNVEDAHLEARLVEAIRALPVEREEPR